MVEKIISFIARQKKRCKKIKEIPLFLRDTR
jgi:hypothetical protein